MDYERIKKDANDILKSLSPECSYIEYKASANQLDKILKTICAYGNNYYDNQIQYIFLGIEEINDNNNKAIPKLPIKGIDKGMLEKCKNSINSLRPFLYPNVSFEIIANKLENRAYLLIVVTRQTGGPFMVSEKAEKDKRINLKPGRYVRVESDSRLARVDEEYDLLRKFANYHFSTITNAEATIDDLNVDFINEYISKTSERNIMETLDKLQMVKSLNLLDKNDPTDKKVKNYAVLMFSDRPDKFINHAYVELIVDMFGTKRKMESKTFKGPLWKQYYAIVNYINDNYLNTIVIREEGVANNRKISNFTYVAVEELVANAIVHNNYENGKPIQIYISNSQINIVNYNRPLPPLRIEDLNERTFFNERDTENPEIRDMFKALGIIESFGTGIGEAKKSLEDNGSPSLYYKVFNRLENITSVVIPANEEYLELKKDGNPQKKLGVEDESPKIKQIIKSSGYTAKRKNNMIKLYEKLQTEVFGNSRVAEILDCSESTATTYLSIMADELKIIVSVEGQGKSKYTFLKK
ncbi:MAG: AAA family ATPase [Lachnospiraceae bacterium]|nr:AAA family ATPase [Lachnospiraceae bacterium]